MTSNSRFVRAAAAIVVILLGMGCACLPISCASAADLAALQKLLPQAESGYTATTDEFKGSDNRGPFILTWKPISQYSEQVYVNGSPMRRGQDYEVDPVSGILAFTERVSSGSTVVVEYSYNPSTATKNNSGARVPLSLDLVKSENSGIRFLAMTSAQSGASLGLSTVGLSGVTKLRGGELSSMLLMSSGPEGSDGSMGDRSALRLGGSTESGKLRLSGSYARVGESFAGSKEYNLTQGSGVMDLSAAYNAAPGLSLTSSLKRTESLMSATKGATVSTTTTGITYNPQPSSQFSVNRVESSTSAPGAEDVKTTADKINLQQNVGSAVTASASYEAVSTDTGGDETSVSTSKLSVVAKPTDKISVKGNILQSDSSTVGQAKSVDVSVDAAAGKDVSISAAMIRQESEVEGQSNKDSITIKAAPGADVSVQVNVVRKETEASGEEISQGVKVSAKPVKAVEVSGSYKNREQENTDAPDSMDVAVQIQPAKSVKLTGTFAKNPEDSTGAVSRTNSSTLGLNTDFGSIKLRGAYSLNDDYISGGRAEVTEVGLDLRLFEELVLSSTYKTNLAATGNSAQATIYALTYSHKVGSTMNMSLSGKMTTCQGDSSILGIGDSEYRAEAKLGLRF